LENEHVEENKHVVENKTKVRVYLEDFEEKEG
jgi:hypothetical protein